jgi:hypothetical protein
MTSSAPTPSAGAHRFPGQQRHGPLTGDAILTRQLPNAKLGHRGYDKPAVNGLRHEAAVELDNAWTLVADQQAKIADWQKRFDALWRSSGEEDLDADVAVPEQALRILDSAQHEADQVVIDAQAQAGLIVDDAEASARQIVDDARRLAGQILAEARTQADQVTTGGITAGQRALLGVMVSTMRATRDGMEGLITAIECDLGDAVPVSGTPTESPGALYASTAAAAGHGYTDNYGDRYSDSYSYGENTYRR